MAKEGKKYTRREAIKYGTKIGTGAVIWGALGNLTGRAYEFYRDFYNETVQPVIDKANQTANYVEDKKEKVKSFVRN